MSKILIVDDERNMRATLAMMLRASGHEVDEAADGTEGAKKGGSGGFDVVLTDLRMGQRTGLDVLREVKTHQPLTEVIVMTAYGTIESAVEAIRLGASDYLQKPFSEQELLVKVDRAVANRRLAGEVAFLANEFKDRYKFENIVGRSTVMRELLGRVIRIAATDASVLITGESGTGKELIAKAIHANSKRAQRTFVPLNCAAMTESLLESELFGHAKGAFTGAITGRKGLFEEADGGTLFLDEIGEMPLFSQAKLLRALQEGEIRRVGENKAVRVDVRVIAATNQDLKTAVDEKRFRRDLFYRLNVALFEIPALRDRRNDIPDLVRFFIEKHNKKMGLRAKIDDSALDALMVYEFPGNVRELEHLVEQAVANVQNGVIMRDDVLPAGTSPSQRPVSRGLARIVDEAERDAIDEALKALDGNRERVAEALGISVTTLWRKMSRLGITFDGRTS